MLGFVDDTLVLITNLPVPPKEYEVLVDGDQATLLADGYPVQFGAKWHAFTKNSDIDPQTGKIYGKPGQFRCIFGKTHIDFDTLGSARCA